jgi:hypothetical protein
MAADQTFPIRYGFLRPLMTALGLGPGVSRVVLRGGTLTVHMGWGFRAEIPLTSITAARRDDRRVGGIGVHGWRGRWLVNGAASGLVSLSVEPPTPARAVGFPVRLRFVRVSVEDPEGLVTAIAAQGDPTAMGRPSA